MSAHGTAKGVEDSLREVIRDGRALLKDFKAERRAIEELIANAADRIDEQVTKGLEEYAETIKTAIDEAVEKVGREFDKLAKLYLTGDARGKGEHLADVAEHRRNKT